MKAPRFWWDSSSNVGRLLHPLGVIFGLVSARRMMRTGRRVSLPVICIGNFVAGGAGKTPTAIWLAEQFKRRGYQPVFLTRGYGGSEKGPVCVDLEHHSALDIGDEAPLLASTASTIVARDRIAGAELAARYGDLVIMDDGLQNSSLEKDFTLAVIDRGQGLGNERVIPAGPLRAPLATQIQKIDACLIIGDRAETGGFDIKIGKPIFSGRIIPDQIDAARLKDRPCFAFAGIGRPEKFLDSLRAAGAEVTIFKSFPDHHVYSHRELDEIVTLARADGLRLVTTAKDHVRIAAIAPDIAKTINIFHVTLECQDADQLIASIIETLKMRSGAPR